MLNPKQRVWCYTLMGGTFRDGNIGKPTAQEQRYIDEQEMQGFMAKIDAKKKSREEERNKECSKTI